MRELVLSCPEHQAEAWSDALLEAGALAVTVEDADQGSAHEQARFGEPGSAPAYWGRNRLVALLADGLDPAQVVQLLRARTGDAQAGEPSAVRDVPDADWVRATQAQFGPLCVAERVWIVPSWHAGDAALEATIAARPQAVRITLDPGLAFGTGRHATTCLCLAWLVEHLAPGANVLDYGCGSGLLAIAARRLGAGAVHAVDIDPQAVDATRANAAANGVELQASLPGALAPGAHDVVLANILTNPLKVLAPLLSARVAAGGQLVLSGILQEQADEVIAAYAAQHVPLHVWRAQDGWVCLAGRKPWT